MIGAGERIQKNLWAEDICLAKLVQNHLCTRSFTEKKTLFEVFHGRKPDLSNLRVSGCNAFIHTPGEVRSGRFATHSEPNIFVGMGRGNAYCILKPNGNISVSQDVDFHEIDRAFGDTSSSPHSSITFELPR